MTAPKSEKVPKAMEARFAEIAAITDRFAAERLNEEYRQLIRFAVAALCRKRPSPLVTGRAGACACGITHGVGTANFLFDPGQTPHISAGDLYAAFGVVQGTRQGKSKQVRNALEIGQMAPEWTLPSRFVDNTMVWLVSVDGMIDDIGRMPRALLEAAFAKGLIPYVPDPSGRPDPGAASRGGARPRSDLHGIEDPPDVNTYLDCDPCFLRQPLEPRQPRSCSR